jgi:hypothetical protein
VRTAARRRIGGELLPATRGRGPLLQRDYWGVVRRCRLRPSEIAAELARRFPEFAPGALVAFRRDGEAREPLRVGEEMTVRIEGAGLSRVRVVHRDAQTLTLATLAGHPEAGRITFGAYRNRRGDVIVHIRSRARSSSRLRYLGFRTAGEAMQTEVWGDFVNCVAATFGEGLIGPVHAETRRIPDEEGDPSGAPTFRAVED